MAGITDPDRLWRGRQRQFVVRTGIAEDLTTVPTMMLSNGEKRGRGKENNLKLLTEIHLVIGYQ